MCLTAVSPFSRCGSLPLLTPCLLPLFRSLGLHLRFPSLKVSQAWVVLVVGVVQRARLLRAEWPFLAVPGDLGLAYPR